MSRCFGSTHESADGVERRRVERSSLDIQLNGRAGSGAVAAILPRNDRLAPSSCLVLFPKSRPLSTSSVLRPAFAFIACLCAATAQAHLEIEEALTRLEEGTFGNCFECGDEISERRLRALPFAARCKDCEEAREIAERRERQISQRRSAGFLMDVN